MGSLLDRLPFSIPPIALPIAIAVIVLLVIVLFVVPRCSGSNQAEEQPATVEQTASSASSSSSSESASSASSSEASSSSASASSASSEPSASSGASQAASDTASIDKTDDQQKELVELIGQDETTKLLTQASKSKEALWIAAHPDRYAFDGIEVQHKIIKLAADEPAAIAYVHDFPSQYPSADVKNDESLAMSTSSPSSYAPDTKIPHLYQWDRRWGNTVYSSAAFGLTGCGPTSLAMVYQGVTGKTDKNPHDLAILADEHGYMDQYEGTAGAFFTDIAPELGLSCEELYPTSSAITDALSSGKVVIANLGPGSFTERGHFFVLAGLASDGSVIVNDPYSVVRSSQTWDADTIASESITLFSYSKA